MKAMKQFLKEPLVHFLVLGALLFAAYSFLNRGGEESPSQRQVRIGAGEVAWLKETWGRQWQREPTQEELRGLVTDFLREELLSREARAMGLEENDTIVRRRLAQKLEFLIKDTARLEEPSEDELQKFYKAHPELFQTAPRISFTQVFFNSEQRKDASAEAKAALVQLVDAKVNTAALGDRSLLESELRDADPQAVVAQFGAEFSSAIFVLPQGTWQGPVKSAYGVHLVRVQELKPGRQREFAEVKAQIIERWREDRQREGNERYFAGLLKKYDIVLEDGVKPLIGSLAGGKETTR